MRELVLDKSVDIRFEPLGRVQFGTTDNCGSLLDRFDVIAGFQRKKSRRPFFWCANQKMLPRL